MVCSCSQLLSVSTLNRNALPHILNAVTWPWQAGMKGSPADVPVACSLSPSVRATPTNRLGFARSPGGPHYFFCVPPALLSLSSVSEHEQQAPSGTKTLLLAWMTAAAGTADLIRAEANSAFKSGAFLKAAGERSSEMLPQ